MAAQHRQYHPPILSAYLPPDSPEPGYIMGATGPQGFGCEAFYVAQIPCREARAIIIAHHYSHRVVNNSYLHLGVYREGALEGVLQWGYALCPARAGNLGGEKRTAAAGRKRVLLVGPDRSDRGQP